MGAICISNYHICLERNSFSHIYYLFQINMLLKQFDRDGNNELDIDEFIGFYAEAKAMLVNMLCLQLYGKSPLVENEFSIPKVLCCYWQW